MPSWMETTPITSWYNVPVQHWGDRPWRIWRWRRANVRQFGDSGQRHSEKNRLKMTKNQTTLLVYGLLYSSLILSLIVSLWQEWLGIGMITIAPCASRTNCPPFPPKHPERCHTIKVVKGTPNATHFTRSIPCNGCWVSSSQHSHR